MSVNCPELVITSKISQWMYTRKFSLPFASLYFFFYIATSIITNIKAEVVNCLFTNCNLYIDFIILEKNCLCIELCYGVIKKWNKLLKISFFFTEHGVEFFSSILQITVDGINLLKTYCCYKTLGRSNFLTLFIKRNYK